MKYNELKVYYGGGLNQDLDKAIENCLKPFGYERWASGMSSEEIRDLAFDCGTSNRPLKPTSRKAA